MTVKENIFALLSPLVDGRVFPVVAPFETPRPYVTYQRIGGHVITPLAKEVPDKQNGFFQITVWADRPKDADALALQIESAFITAKAFTAKPMAGPIDRSEPDLKLYGSQQDFNVLSDR
ncbi:DUF3168 domain-containing protein [Paraburkholderia sp. CNPSo 3157]|uniref:DUF3168 domain-containing protein n=1 Tax=Paraburkholderia franconis TaxID=2654983 RepID=A0A7X1TFY9_9BURK|nr:DUF3168 domain-containing protein [Paraburkholderia franconis]MPW17877.1 DUF3168 domain-containing protein [Paraburkholderia franconis]